MRETKIALIELYLDFETVLELAECLLTERRANVPWLVIISSIKVGRSFSKHLVISSAF